MGGSTITQQVAKNLCVGKEKGFCRKIKEAIMAFRIESFISKDKILEVYLNAIYLGKGCYGAAEALDYYFGKSLDKATPEEAAFIAAIPNAPTIYSNMEDMSKILLKRNSILYQMHEQKYISDEELERSLQTPISFKKKKCDLFGKYFSNEIYRTVSTIIPKKHFLENGVTVISTMKKHIQAEAEKSLEDGLILYEHRQRYKGIFCNEENTKNYVQLLKCTEKMTPRTINLIFPVVVIDVKKDFYECVNSSLRKIKLKRDIKIFTDVPDFKKGDVIFVRETKKDEFELYQEPGATGGIVVMDPYSGEVMAMVGGYSFEKNIFNCVTQAKRQPGSCIKPFVYASALENGMRENDVIADKAVSIRLSNGKIYSPSNYDKKELKEIVFRDALIHSRNLPTIDISLKIGMDAISKTLRDFGLLDGAEVKKIPISSVLGSIETTLINLTAAFCTFLNKGFKITPRLINSIKPKIEPGLLPKDTQERIISEETAKTMKGILNDVVKRGTASKIKWVEKAYEIEVGGKTGTTNGYKDSWFIGYIKTKEGKIFVVGVFVGKENGSTLGKKVTGSTVALSIFLNFIQNMFKEHNL
jgi:penicillin-binding protein 1A